MNLVAHNPGLTMTWPVDQPGWEEDCAHRDQDPAGRAFPDLDWCVPEEIETGSMPVNDDAPPSYLMPGGCDGWVAPLGQGPSSNRALSASAFYRSVGAASLSPPHRLVTTAGLIASPLPQPESIPRRETENTPTQIAERGPAKP